jgi:hypothetical protein
MITARLYPAPPQKKSEPPIRQAWVGEKEVSKERCQR